MSPSSSPRAGAAAAVAQTAAYVSLGGVVAVVLPLVVQQVALDAKENALASISATSSIVTALSLPWLGHLSDRTPTAWGPRAPWIVGGAVVGAGAIALLPHASTVLALALLWVVAQVALNAVDAGAAAVVADDVVPGRRGAAASLLGLATGVGSGVGVLVVAGRSTDTMAATLTLCVITVAGGLAFLPARGRGARYRTVPARVRRGGRNAGVLAGLLGILRAPDLRRVLLSRVALILGVHSLTAFQLYILVDHVGLSTARAATVTALNAVVFLACIATGGLAAGRWSDTTRRTPFLVVGALLVAVAAVLPGILPSSWSVVALAALGGLGTGAFLTVQLAQSIDLLPSPAHAGRDLGLLGTATTATQSLAPLVTASALSLGLGYGPVFLTAAACALLAAGVQLVPARRDEPRDA